MKRCLFYILMMLLALPAAFSCSQLTMNEGENHRLVITGTVSDFSTDTPLEGIKISFTASLKGDINGKPIYEMNVYTDNHGAYIIDTDSYPNPLTCTITACDTENIYKSSKAEVEVTWSGTAYDSLSSMFIVNDCNFKLEKK